MRNLFSAEIFQCGIFSAELFQCGSFSAESSVRNFHCGDSVRKLPFSASIQTSNFLAVNDLGENLADPLPS